MTRPPFRLPLLFLVLAPLVLTACSARPSPEAQRIQDALPRDVANCEMVQEVYGTAQGFHLSESAAMTTARNMALEQAATARATHVVWTNIEDGLSSYITGTAYRC